MSMTHDGLSRIGMHPATWLTTAARPEQPGDPLNVPIMPASNYRPGGDHYYGRSEPSETVEALELVVGGLESGHGVAFASGMAAVSAVLDLVPVGGEIALPQGCYQGVTQAVAAGVAAGRWRSSAIGARDTAQWAAALERCALVWLESPTNPLLDVLDLDLLCVRGAEPRALVAVDNTFATPLGQQPLELGADLVVHSATKFIGGHSDLLAGLVVVQDSDLATRIRRHRALAGSVPGALESFLATRGARTLALRLERGQASARVLADRLAAAPWVRTIRYPGRTDHPTYAAAKRQLTGPGALLSFDTVGSAEDADRFLGALRIVTVATSLGGVESTVERRAGLPGQEHLPPTLIRMSVGCEHVEDIWDDIAQAAARVFAAED